MELYCGLVLLLAFVGEALFGFGGGLVSVPLLSLAIGVRDAVVLASIFQCLLGFLVLTNYRDVAWAMIRPLLVGVFAGVIIGAYSLPLFDPNVLRRILALFILAFLGKTLLAPNLAVTKPGVFSGATSGLLSGFFQGCLGTGGPNLVMYLTRIVPEQRAFRATMICALSVSSFVRMPFFASAELFTPFIRSIAIPVLPFFLIGVVAGQRMHHRVPSRWYFRSVYVFLFLSAITLLWRSVGESG